MSETIRRTVPSHSMKILKMEVQILKVIGKIHSLPPLISTFKFEPTLWSLPPHFKPQILKTNPANPTECLKCTYKCISYSLFIPPSQQFNHSTYSARDGDVCGVSVAGRSVHGHFQRRRRTKQGEHSPFECR